MEKQKPKYSVGCTGHIDLSRINRFAEREETLRFQIRAYFDSLKQKFSPTLYSGLANGADSLFAEEALNRGVRLVAVLPKDVASFRNEQGNKTIFDRLYSSASEVVLCPNGYVGVMNKIIEASDEIVTLWDGVALPLYDENNCEINRGGTYDLICTAERAHKKIKHFN